MKTATDPRHIARRLRFKRIYSKAFSPRPFDAEVDNLISKAAPEWPIDKINKVDLSVLRLAVTELKKGSTPTKVVVDEAVELAKEYGSEKSGSFVNGVLGTIIKIFEKTK
ncbi:MAG: transcription antitermination factor NusB [Patescibacteria group bacterium]